MIKTYSKSDAQKNLDAVLRHAARTGVAFITTKSGRSYQIRPVESNEEILKRMPIVDLGITPQELVGFIREDR